MQSELENAYDDEDLGLFMSLLTKEDVDEYLTMSIQNFNYEFATAIINKFNKYQEGAQIALESGVIDILRGTIS